MADSAATLPFDAAVRSRRTHKVFGREPVPRETLDELFELARWAPNHHLTQPWRFRVVGPQAPVARHPDGQVHGAAASRTMSRA